MSFFPDIEPIELPNTLEQYCPTELSVMMECSVGAQSSIVATSHMDYLLRS